MINIIYNITPSGNLLHTLSKNSVFNPQHATFQSEALSILRR